MKKWTILVVVLILATLACNITFVTPAPQPTKALPTLAPPTVVPPTQTPRVVTATPVPTSTSTPTPAAPYFTATVSANCRLGPSTAYDPPLTFFLTGQSAPIIGRTPDGTDLWWLVIQNTYECWASNTVGTVSGNVASVPVVSFWPPVPTATANTVKVIFNNTSGSNVCRIDFFVDTGVTSTANFDRGEFKDGDSIKVFVPVGHYDLIEAWNCKADPKVVAVLTNEDINRKNREFYLGDQPTPTP